MLAIADFADDEGQAFPGIKTLARKSRLTERHVKRTLRDLVASGELVIEDQAGPKGCNLYIIQLAQMSDRG